MIEPHLCSGHLEARFKHMKSPPSNGYCLVSARRVLKNSREHFLLPTKSPWCYWPPPNIQGTRWSKNIQSRSEFENTFEVRCTYFTARSLLSRFKYWIQCTLHPTEENWPKVKQGELCFPGFLLPCMACVSAEASWTISWGELQLSSRVDLVTSSAPRAAHFPASVAYAGSWQLTDHEARFPTALLQAQWTGGPLEVGIENSHRGSK